MKNKPWYKKEIKWSMDAKSFLILAGIVLFISILVDMDFSWLTREDPETGVPIMAIFMVLVYWQITRLVEWCIAFRAGIWWANRKK